MASGPLFNGYHANGILDLPEDEEDKTVSTFMRVFIFLHSSVLLPAELFLVFMCWRCSKFQRVRSFSHCFPMAGLRDC